jgi:hypothetical protein
MGSAARVCIAALEQLEIVGKIPAGPSYGDLRFNPCWDSLRGDKRFDKIVAQPKLPADLVAQKRRSFCCGAIWSGSFVMGK